MARKKKIEIIDEKQAEISFDFYKNEVEGDEVKVLAGDKVFNPLPNFSGSFNLDFDLDIPFPEGRITEIFGEEGTCKTTLSLQVAGEAIKRGKKVLYVNMEKNLNLSLLKTIRSLRPYVDEAISGKEDCPLWIVNATTGEQALEAIRKFCSMVPNGVAILDSVDAAQPSAVLSGEIGEQKVGNLAKMMSDAMRKMIAVAESNRVAVILINQVREKITMYGDPQTTPGGNAIKFYASQRIKLSKPRKTDIIVNADGDQIGVIIRYKIIKNKVAPDGNEGQFYILYKNGIFSEFELVQQCCNFGILRMGGKGGKQVYIPKLDRETGEFEQKDGERVESCMTQFNAARRLLMDSALTKKLGKDLSEILEQGKYHAVDSLTEDEV